MHEVFIKYNPYKLETEIKINGNLIAKDSELYPLTNGRRMQEWIVDFPANLRNMFNTREFKITFRGMALDYDDVKEAFDDAKYEGILSKVDVNWVKTRDNDEIKNRVTEIFDALYNGEVAELKDECLKKQFDKINDAVFPVNVVATMSSGKSTLINALLGHKLMPYQNVACTAKITEITDNDADYFEGEAFDKDGKRVSKRIEQLKYEDMEKFNNQEEVFKIKIDGDIPFIDARTDILRLVDTPGPNNSLNQAHKEITYKALNSDSNNIILYVLNAGAIGINDDASLLDYVAEQMRKGSKEIRDRFIFVINKMDEIDPDTDNIEETIKEAKDYLSEHGISNPQIFPCSALVAFNLRTELKNVDISNLSPQEKKKLSVSAKMTKNIIKDVLLPYEEMHLEKYTTLSPSAQSEIEVRLQIAEEEGDEKEQALIHSGIVSIEAAIIAYVKKYAKTRKVRDLVESFQATLNSSTVFAKLQNAIQSDSKVAEEFAKKAAAIEAKIKKGEDSQVFKKKIEAFDPMEKIDVELQQLRFDTQSRIESVFKYSGKVINDRNQAQMLVKQFVSMASDQMAALGANIESTVNRDVIEAGEKIINEYRAKLEGFDENSSLGNIDFKTADLVQGELKKMRDSIKEWKKDNFSDVIIGDIADSKYETKTYHVKVGTEPERRIKEYTEVKIGEKKVILGYHEEFDHWEKISKWYNPLTWGKRKAIYKTVTDYGTEDVFKTVPVYETVMRDIFEMRKETIEKFSMKTQDLSVKLLSPYMLSVDRGIEASKRTAEEQIEKMKNGFISSFDKVDDIIARKYDELISCTDSQNKKNEEIEENRRILQWLEVNKQELDKALDM